MQREIVLSSYSVKNQYGNKPEDFTTNFTRPIIRLYRTAAILD